MQRENGRGETWRPAGLPNSCRGAVWRFAETEMVVPRRLPPPEKLERPGTMQGQPNTGTEYHLVALQDQILQAQQAGDRQVEQDLHLQFARMLSQCKRYDEAMMAYSAAWVLTLFTRDEGARLIALLGEGRLYLRSHQPEQAEFLLKEGLELAREQANWWAEAECLCGLAHTSLLAGNPHRALHLAELARAISREWGNQAIEADVMNVLAFAHAQCGEPEQAATLHQTALLIAREWDASEIEAAHLSNLGILRIRELAQPERGMADLQRALTLYKEQEDDEGLAQALALLAEGVLHLQQWEKALGYIEEAAALACGLKWWKYRLHIMKADALTGLDRREEALHERGWALASLFPTKALIFRALFEDHHAALAGARARGDQREEAAQLIFLARSQIPAADLRGFVSYYEQALQVYFALGDFFELGNHLIELGWSLAQTYPGMRLRGKRARALAYWRAGLDILREVNCPPPWEGRELERFKTCWGENAYQRARASSERYYRALMISLAPRGDAGDRLRVGGDKRTEVCP